MVFTARPTILVVEDDSNLLLGIRDILEVAHYEVLSASNGLEALNVLHEHSARPPNVIVSDIGMPHLDGYGLLDAVRQEREWMEIPFIFLTARTERGDIRTGMVAGADDYLPKPFKTNDLLLAIQAKLKRRAELADVRSLQIREIKRTILTILNHEFRTPLSPVIAYAEMLDNDPETFSVAELRLFLRGINTGAQRLRRLIENFMLLIELETGEAQAAFNYRRTLITNVNEILYRVSGQAAIIAQDMPITIEIQPTRADLPPFMGDPQYLVDALMRLVDNAIKFSTKPNSHIWLGAQADASGEHVLLSVTDEGRGIPANKFDAIFDAFYQINREHYEDQGTGSGLAIVKAIAALHNAKISVESEIGKGSMFTLHLPVA